MAIEKATFGAGCFWGVEARFAELTGVIDTAVGYEGGDLEHPTYKDVCTDRTGHAEVVQVTFDQFPSHLRGASGRVLRLARSDPGQPPRAGLGHASIAASSSPTTTVQFAEARARIAELNASGTYRNPIATQVVPAAPSGRLRSITSAISKSAAW